MTYLDQSHRLLFCCALLGSKSDGGLYNILRCFLVMHKKCMLSLSTNRIMLVFLRVLVRK